MSGSQAPDLTALFGSAVATGDLTAAAAQVINVPDYGAAIQAGIGISIDNVTASEVFLIGELDDDSTSIRFVTGNTEAVRSGHNHVIEALRDSKQGDGILSHCRYLNGHVLYPFCSIDQAVLMDATNFNPNGSTPLYDQTVVMLATMLAKAQEFLDAGVVCRTATLIVTDGHDEGSYRSRASDVKKIVMDMLRTERHIVAGMGISDGRTDFHRVFGEMGIPFEWILTPKNNPSEIRRAFGVFSKSAVRASQAATGAAFSKVAAGGFGTP